MKHDTDMEKLLNEILLLHHYSLLDPVMAMPR
jgi:hypothetical protein